MFYFQVSRLFQSGYPVPDGFVILPQAIADHRLTPQAWLQVEAQWARLRHHRGDAAFAIRSSGLSEDGARASFAGEFETVLGVQTETDLRRQAITAVHRSGHSERVQAYSRAQKLDPQPAMAVVVQRMVPSRLAGVLFTADPLTGDHTHMEGNFEHGLGHQLVSGEVNGEAFPDVVTPLTWSLVQIYARKRLAFPCRGTTRLWATLPAVSTSI